MGFFQITAGIFFRFVFAKPFKAYIQHSVKMPASIRNVPDTFVSKKGSVVLTTDESDASRHLKWSEAQVLKRTGLKSTGVNL